MGLASSTRRPTRPTILSMVRRRWASLEKLGLDPEQLAEPLDEDLVVAVDHDLGDLRVAEERLQGAVAQDLVSDLLRHPGAVGGRERGLLQLENGLQGLPDPLFELGLLHPRVVQLRAKRLQQRLVHAVLDLGERVLMAGRPRTVRG